MLDDQEAIHQLVRATWNDLAPAPSERQAEHELELPWRSRADGRRIDRGLNHAELRWNGDIAEGSAQLRTIERVECLGSNFRVHPFGQRDSTGDAQVDLIE